MWTNTPLSGIKVVEFAGLAPAPYAGMVLADFGADVIRIDKPGGGHSDDILARGKRSISVSAKTKAGQGIIRKLIERCDVLIDPFRPGVMEKLGFGPDEMLNLNPKLIYARMYGFERDSKYQDMAGHDINYSALSGVLAMLGPNGSKPSIPLNILADFAGGGIMCAMGIILALMERTTSKRGQVVNADMVSGLRYIASFSLILNAITQSNTNKSSELLVLDGSLPYYTVYQTKDNLYVSLGALENRFYSIFLDRLKKALEANEARDAAGSLLHENMPEAADQYTSSKWPQVRQFLETAFLSRTRDEWEQVFLKTDACVAPVLQPSEVLRQKGSPIPHPAPHLSRTPAKAPKPHVQSQTVTTGDHTLSVLQELGLSTEEIQRLENTRDVEIKRRADSKL